MDEIIVLSLGKPYDIPGENGAANITGCTMWYVPCGDMSKTESEDGVLGYAPVKERMGVDFYETAKAVGLPAKARVEYGMKSSAGKMTLYIKGLEFLPEKEKK